MKPKTSYWNARGLNHCLRTQGAKQPDDLPGYLPVAPYVVPTVNLEGYDLLERLQQEIITGVALDAVAGTAFSETANRNIYAINTTVRITTGAVGACYAQFQCTVPTGIGGEPIAFELVPITMNSNFQFAIHSQSWNLVIPPGCGMYFRVFSAGGAGSEATITLNYIDLKDLDI